MVVAVGYEMPPLEILGVFFSFGNWVTISRENLKRVNWLGAVNLTADEKSERYMNPSTIKNILSKHPLYQENQRMTSNCQD